MAKRDTGRPAESLALGKYGRTEDVNMAVWLLRDGTMVNGSFEGRQRDLDHRHIREFYPGLDEDAAMRRFMLRGNIRMGFSVAGPCFEFLVPPSEEQLKRLVPWAHWATRHKTDFCAVRHARRTRICESPWQFLYYVSKWMRRNVFDYPLDPFGK